MIGGAQNFIQGKHREKETQIEHPMEEEEECVGLWEGVGKGS